MENLKSFVPLSKEEVHKRVVACVVTHLNLDTDKTDLTWPIANMGADSLDLLEICMAVEEVCQVAIPDEDAQTCRTIDQAVEVVIRLQGLLLSSADQPAAASTLLASSIPGVHSAMVAAVAAYQCPGCTKGISPSDCEHVKLAGEGCSAHFPGAIEPGAGVLAVGLPNGFNRYGPAKVAPIKIYESCEALERLLPGTKTIFSVPVWQHLDERGNTVMRWFSPRTNSGWSLVILGDCRSKFPGALEITADQIADMS